jgi:hypothetical protein
MAFASVKRENLRWTRGHPSTFVSSNVAERNFCSTCGTPLTYHRVESGSIAVTIGSLDTPEAVRPIEQFGIESELSWISGLRALPAKRTEDWKREYSILNIDSHQYLPARWSSKDAFCRGTWVDALKLHRAQYDDKLQALRPVHDWTSHAAESFRYLALTLDRRATHSGFYRRIDYPQQGVVW